MLPEVNRPAACGVMSMKVVTVESLSEMTILTAMRTAATDALATELIQVDLAEKRH